MRSFAVDRLHVTSPLIWDTDEVIRDDAQLGKTQDT